MVNKMHITNSKMLGNISSKLKLCSPFYNYDPSNPTHSWKHFEIPFVS